MADSKFLKTASILLVFLFAASERAVQAEYQEKDLAGQLQGRHPGTSALALAVIREGRVSAVQFAGIEGKSENPVGPETVFRACSLSKPVFAFLVMRMVDRRLIGLDQPLLDLPRSQTSSLQDYSDVASDPRFKLLTARVILTHQGGFPNWRWQEPDGRLRFKFDPGSSFSYSGEGYRFLQTVIEKTSGRHLDHLAAQEIFSFLKMRTASFLLTDSLKPRLSFDITAIPPFFREQMARERNAAGSLLCTIGDYAGFLETLIAGIGLSERSRSEMLKPEVKMTAKTLFGPQRGEPGGWREGAEAFWCLGWIYFRSSLGECYFHVGAEEGFENFAVFFPKQRSGLVVFSSGPSPTGVARDAVESVFGATGIPFAWMGYR
ncbi:MAG TPA: serine hydrolase domain-containing protein [Candidatus Binatia bacterium]|nr:serine hydrolase domain-containing protein [Candidatus Binatia bacterium]